MDYLIKNTHLFFTYYDIYILNSNSPSKCKATIKLHTLAATEPISFSESQTSLGPITSFKIHLLIDCFHVPPNCLLIMWLGRTLMKLLLKHQTPTPLVPQQGTLPRGERKLFISSQKGRQSILILS